MISIIIPTYNRAHLISATLDSIRMQTYEHWECIVVDDGSTDTTIQVVEDFIKKDSRFQLYKRPESLPKGGNSCRNYGFEKSNGDFIQWFDSDDLLVPEALEEKMRAFGDDIHMVYTGFKTFSGQPDNILATYNCEPVNSVLKDYLVGNIVLNIPSFVYRRELVASMRFSEKLTRAQDLDFVFRCISQENLKIEQVLNAHCLVRLHEQTITSQFSELRITDLNSEILVREHIFNSASNFEKPYVFYAAQKYFNTLKKLITAGEYKLFNEKLDANRIVGASLKRKLAGIAIIHKITKRGLSRYNKLVKKEYQ